MQFFKNQHTTPPPQIYGIVTVTTDCGLTAVLKKVSVHPARPLATSLSRSLYRNNSSSILISHLTQAGALYIQCKVSGCTYAVLQEPTWIVTVTTDCGLTAVLKKVSVHPARPLATSLSRMKPQYLYPT
jgi:hypothetical protein